jgi:PKD repeat protein
MNFRIGLWVIPALIAMTLLGCPAPVPELDFAAQPRSGVAALSVNFLITTQHDETAVVEWEFGDGSQSTDLAPTHVYEAAGAYTVTLRVTEAGGTGTTTKEAFVVVSSPVDTSAPVISLNGSVEVAVECGEGYVDAGATALDAEDGEVAVTAHGVPTGSAPGSYTITYTAQDAAGNAAAPVERVVRIMDGVAPVITLNSGDMTMACGAMYTEPGATALDACEGAVPVRIATEGGSNGSGSFVVRYSAVDSSGNEAVAMRTVTLEDQVAPRVWLVGGDLIVECGSAFEDPGAAASDDCDADPVISVSGEVGTTPGEYELHYTATDAAGNVSEVVTRRVTVVDTEAPVLSGVAAEMVWECGVPFTWDGVTASDACDGAIPVLAQGVPDVPLAAGIYSVRYMATDGAGNRSVQQQNLEVVDSTAPTIRLTPAGPMRVALGSEYEVPTVSVEDACEGLTPIVVSVGGDVVDTGAEGLYRVRYEARDSAGNTGEAYLEVEVYVVPEPCEAAEAWSGLYGEEEEFSQVAATGDCGFVLASATSMSGFWAGPDMRLRKLDATGSVDWERPYSFELGFFDSIQELANGDLLLIGRVGEVDEQNFVTSSTMVKRLTALGEEVWSTPVPAPGGYIYRGACETEAGEIWVARAVYASTFPIDGTTLYDTEVLVLGADGTLEDIVLHRNLDPAGIAPLAGGGAVLLGRVLVFGEEVFFEFRTSAVYLQAAALERGRRQFEIPGNDRFDDLAVTPDGCVVGGLVSSPETGTRFLAMKLDRLGEPAWTFEGTEAIGDGWVTVSANRRGEIALLTTGPTFAAAAGMYAAKLGAGGALEWQRAYGDCRTEGRDVALGHGGDLLISSSTEEWSDFGPDLYLIKTDVAGDAPEAPEVPGSAGWLIRYELPLPSISAAFAPFQDGYAFVTREPNAQAPAPPWLVRTDTEGVPLGHQEIGGYNDLPSVLLADAGGGLIVAGARRMADTSTDRYVMRIDGNGARFWNRDLPGAGNDVLHSGALGGSGCILAGSRGEGDSTQRPCAVSVDLEGNVSWDRVYGVAGEFRFVLAGRDRALLCGHRGAAGSRSPYAAMVDGEGGVVWEQMYRVTGDTYLTCGATLAEWGYVFAGGSSPTTNTVPVIRVGSEGELQWEQSLPLDRSEARAVMELSDGTLLLAVKRQGNQMYFYGLDGDGENLRLLNFAYLNAGASTTLMERPDGFLMNGWRYGVNHQSPALGLYTADLATDRFYLDYVLD